MIKKRLSYLCFLLLNLFPLSVSAVRIGPYPPRPLPGVTLLQPNQLTPYQWECIDRIFMSETGSTIESLPSLKIILKNKKLNLCKFIDCHFQKSIFCGSTFIKTIFKDSSIIKSDLRETNFDEAIFVNVQLDDHLLSDITLCNNFNFEGYVFKLVKEPSTFIKNENGITRFIKKKILTRFIKNEKGLKSENIENNLISKKTHIIPSLAQLCVKCLIIDNELSDESKELFNQFVRNCEVNPKIFDLSGLMIKDVDFSGLCLKNFNFSHCHFINIKSENVDLTEANFDEAIVGRINLGGTNYTVVLNIDNRILTNDNK